MRIEVTEQDIRKAERGSACLCPVALALKRQLGDRWTVARWHVTFDRDDTGWRAENAEGGRLVLPVDVAERLEAYDRGEQMTPFAFEVSQC